MIFCPQQAFHISDHCSSHASAAHVPWNLYSVYTFMQTHLRTQRKHVTSSPPTAFVIDATSALLKGQQRWSDPDGLISQGLKHKLIYKLPPPRGRLNHTGCNVGGAFIPDSNKCHHVLRCMCVCVLTCIAACTCYHSGQACGLPAIPSSVKVMSPVVSGDI